MLVSLIDSDKIPKWISTLPNNIKVVIVILVGLHVFGILLVVLM